MKNLTLFKYLAIIFFLFLGFDCSNALAAEVDSEVGYTYTDSRTTFYFVSSSASEVYVVVEGYTKDDGKLIRDPLNPSVWTGSIEGDLNGKEYSYSMNFDDGTEYQNILDPYGRYVNGDNTKNIIVDESIVTFQDWENQIENQHIYDVDKIIYGVNVDGFSSHASWKGTEINRGNLLALIESGTKYNNVLTGFDYINSLGVTYIEISPINDSSVMVACILVSLRFSFQGII